MKEEMSLCRKHTAAACLCQCTLTHPGDSLTNPSVQEELRSVQPMLFVNGGCAAVTGEM